MKCAECAARRVAVAKARHERPACAAPNRPGPPMRWRAKPRLAGPGTLWDYTGAVQ